MTKGGKGKMEYELPERDRMERKSVERNNNSKLEKVSKIIIRNLSLTSHSL